MVATISAKQKNSLMVKAIARHGTSIKPAGKCFGDCFTVVDTGAGIVAMFWYNVPVTRSTHTIMEPIEEAES